MKIVKSVSGIILVVLGISLVGCGKATDSQATKKQNKCAVFDCYNVATESGLCPEHEEIGQNTEVTLPEAVTQHKAVAKSTSTPTPTTLPTPTQSPSPTPFPKDAGWENVSVNFAVQIDDVIYTPGLSVSECMAIIDSSAVDYTYEYSPNRLMAGREKYTLSVYRNQAEWFMVQVYNPWNTTKELAEVLVDKIIPSEDALNYCYFIDGRSYMDIMQMSYSDIKKLAEEKFGGAFTETSCEINGQPAICMSVSALVQAPYGEEYTFFDSSRVYIFTINKNDSSLLSFEQGDGTGIITLKHTPPAPEPILSFSELTEEEMNTLKDNAVAYIKLRGLYKEELLAMYLFENTETSTTTLTCLFHAYSLSGGKIVKYYLDGFGRKKDGTLAYESATCTNRDSHAAKNEKIIADYSENLNNLLDSRIIYLSQ